MTRAVEFARLTTVHDSDRQRLGLTVIGVTGFVIGAVFGNIILARLALAERMIDAATFTTVRILSGSIVLVVIVRLGQARTSRALGADAPPRGRILDAGSWTAAAALFLYAVPYSYAYLELHAGLGAFTFMSTVQVFMIGWGIARGERPRFLRWLGLAIALGGLAFLALPGATRPHPLYAGLMLASGLAWAFYCVLGIRSTSPPLVATAANFTRCLSLIAILSVVAALFGLHAEPLGVLCAVVSGALGSGVGYAMWYMALRGLTASMAAIIQLMGPVLVSMLAIVTLNEPVTDRLLAIGCAMLVGLGLAAYARERS